MRLSPQNAVVLAGSFCLSFALLLGAWLLVAGPRPAQSLPGNSVASTPAVTIVDPTRGSQSPNPTLIAAAPASLSPAPTRPPFVVPWGSPAPLRTPGPPVTPGASLEPSEKLVVMLNGSEFAESVVPTHGEVTVLGSAATLDTTRSSGEPLWVTWRLSRTVLPANAAIISVDVRICGQGEGDFWEVYGPDGGDTFEYEVTPPGPDGCWLFANAPGHDLSVLGGVQLRSRLTITHLEYTFTLAR